MMEFLFFFQDVAENGLNNPLYIADHKDVVTKIEQALQKKLNTSVKFSLYTDHSHHHQNRWRIFSGFIVFVLFIFQI